MNLKKVACYVSYLKIEHNNLSIQVKKLNQIIGKNEKLVRILSKLNDAIFNAVLNNKMKGYCIFNVTGSREELNQIQQAKLSMFYQDMENMMFQIGLKDYRIQSVQNYLPKLSEEQRVQFLKSESGDTIIWFTIDYGRYSIQNDHKNEKK